MTTKTENGVTRKALWGAVAFYLLIAFEILYMAGPFAIYFYGVYNPIQNFLERFPVLSELNRFMLPHISRETSSALLDALPPIGGTVAALGLAAFLIGACQIYYSKFTKKGAVTGGIYNRIRHPQYVSFAICGFGLLIVWPRMINLLMFVTMLFVYYLLAKAEERECEEKFGLSYIGYVYRTNMFFPFILPFKLPKLPEAKAKRRAILFSTYVCAMVVFFFAAKGLTNIALDSLYATYTEDSATVSLAKMENEKLLQIMDIASADESVQAILSANSSGKLINYVLPQEWYASEIPMSNTPERDAHVSPPHYDRAKYKVIITAARVRGNVSGKDILTSVTQREALAEVWVDLDKKAVTRLAEIPDSFKYSSVPLAAY